MSKWWILTGALLFGQVLQAQITLGIGYEQDGFDREGLNSFIRSYNEYFGANIVEPLKEIQPADMRGFKWGFGYRYLHKGFTLATGMDFGSSRHSFISRVPGNFSQEHHLRFKDVNVMFSGGPLIAKTVMLEGILNFGFRNSTLDVLTVFPDGSKSQGYEFDINGVYTTFTPCYEAGLGLGIRLGRFLLSGRVTKDFNLLGDDRGLDATTLLDFDVNRYRAADFPRDFQVWIDNNPDLITENVIYSGELRGTRISLNLEFLLFAPKSLQE